MQDQQNHRAAVDAAIAECEHGLSAADGPLLALVRQLASEMDRGEPGSRLVASYLTAVRTLNMRLAAVGKDQGSGKLAELRSRQPRNKGGGVA